MCALILVYLLFLSLNDIDSALLNQTTEETTNENVLNETQTKSTGMELTDNTEKHQTTLSLLDLIYDNCLRQSYISSRR